MSPHQRPAPARVGRRDGVVLAWSVHTPGSASRGGGGLAVGAEFKSVWGVGGLHVGLATHFAHAGGARGDSSLQHLPRHGRSREVQTRSRPPRAQCGVSPARGLPSACASEGGQTSKPPAMHGAPQGLVPRGAAEPTTAPGTTGTLRSTPPSLELWVLTAEAP